MMTLRQLLSFSVAFACLAASAAIEIPKASGTALGVTRGKAFSEGLVFVDGRYIEPPYVVERWGVGIRINGIPVVGQVIDWTEFLKTQSGVKVTKSESAPAAAAPEPEPEPEPEELDDADTSLDDLFDDDSSKSKKPVKKVVKKPVRKPKPAKPTVSVSYELEGPFVHNDVSKALVKKINKTRTEINVILLEGGFICFGQNYARVSGDSRIANEILEKLPEIEKNSSSGDALVAAVRAANLLYLTEPICRDLHRNRVDYLKLQTRRDKVRSERALKKLMNGREKNSF